MKFRWGGIKVDFISVVGEWDQSAECRYGILKEFLETFFEHINNNKQNQRQRNKKGKEKKAKN